MAAQIPNTETTVLGQSTNRRLKVLGMLLVAAILALAMRVALLRNTPPANPLHGDGEEAMGALDKAVTGMPEPARLPFLLKSVQDVHPGLRYAAVDALGQYPTPETAAAIEQAFQDSASIVRQRAAETLHKVDRERGYRLLLAALQDEDSWIRTTAVTQLTMRVPSSGSNVKKPVAAAGSETSIPALTGPGIILADRRAVPLLIRALDDDNDTVTQQAVGLLYHLTGSGRLYRVADGDAGKQKVLAEWRAWWTANASRYPGDTAFARIQPIRPTRSDPAPDFDLRDTAGRPITLSAQHGKVTLLNFWGTWCPPCRMEIPFLERIHEEFGGRGLDVIGAAVSESNGDAGLSSWCGKHGITYRQALSTPDLQEAYGDIHEVPVSVLIDRQGRIRYRWEGDRDYNTFRAAVQRLLAE